MIDPSRNYLIQVHANRWLFVAVTAIALLCGNSLSYATTPNPVENTFFIVRDGKPSATIIIPDNAVLCVQAAANELQYHIRESSGATLKIVKESKKPSTPGGLIYLGDCKATIAMGIDTKSLGPRACYALCIRCPIKDV